MAIETIDNIYKTLLNDLQNEIDNNTKINISYYKKNK